MDATAATHYEKASASRLRRAKVKIASFLTCLHTIFPYPSFDELQATTNVYFANFN